MANLFQPIIFVSFMRNAQHYYYWATDNPENLAYRYADSFGASPDLILVVISRTIRDGLDSAPLIVRGTVLGSSNFFPISRASTLQSSPLQTVCHSGEVACFEESHIIHCRVVDSQERTYETRCSILGLEIAEL